MKILHIIAGMSNLFVIFVFSVSAFICLFSGNKAKEASSEDDPDEMSDLYEEATMSIEELITKYGKRIRDGAKEGDEMKEGRSTNPALDFVVSKLIAKKAKKAAAEESSASEAAKAGAAVKEDQENKDEKPAEDSDKPTSTDPEKPAQPELEEIKDKQSSPPKAASPESNGKHQNGSSNHDADNSKQSAPVVVVSSKGKGVGKGLSNNIRKAVEKTPEELELERREAERIAKRLERKKSLRNKSGDELYRLNLFILVCFICFIKVTKST